MVKNTWTDLYGNTEVVGQDSLEKLTS